MDRGGTKSCISSGISQIIEIGIEIIGEYVNAVESYEMILQLQPDVVFLDIEMPGLSGLAIGEKIQETLPNTEVVFVTGYDQYAIDAFNIHAIDYVLKPVQQARLQRTLIRIQQIIGKKPEEIRKSTTIQLLGAIQVISEDGQVEMMKWRTAKAKELFAYMIYRYDEVIYRDTLIDLFWPDTDIGKAKKQLYTTIYMIRQTLKNMD